jgi:hypothetical protein
MVDTTHQADAALSLRFELDAKEWGRAELAAIRATPFGRFTWHATRILPLIVPLPFAAAVLIGAKPTLDVITTGAPWELLALLFYAIYPLWASLGAPLIARRIRGRPEERIVSDAGLDLAGSIDATFVPWAEVRWVRETPEFYLFRGPRAVYFVPKRLLTDSQDRHLRSLLSEHVRVPVQLLPGAGRAT